MFFLYGHKKSFAVGREIHTEVDHKGRFCLHSEDFGDIPAKFRNLEMIYMGK
jgi:hypothetical protein